MKIARTALAVVLGLLLAYNLWQAVASIVDLVGHGVVIRGSGWVVLIAAAIAPVAGFVAALLLGRGRALWALALLYVTALAVSWLAFLTLSALLARVGGIGLT
ncbi:MAG TPA: hypothetical protein VFU07_07440 [Candidatus Lumbricidophila sp.]|nr:hypothetical protein [Candidatus Lumbricidophila sp.]